MRDALGQVLDQIAQKIFSSGFSKAITPLFGSIGGDLGSLFAGFFDKGGMIPSDQFGVVGERGPEIVQGPAHVTSRADTARMMGGGQIELVVRNEPGTIVEMVRNEAGAMIQQSQPDTIRRSVEASGEAMRATGRYGRP